MKRNILEITKKNQMGEKKDAGCTQMAIIGTLARRKKQKKPKRKTKLEMRLSCNKISWITLDMNILQFPTMD